MEIFQDRRAAGRRLAGLLEPYRGAGTLALGVPRGGVVVAAEVAAALAAELDVIIARKLGAPYQPELAIGAVISSGYRLLDEPAIRYLQVTPEYIEAETERQVAEIRRRMDHYRDGLPAPNVAGRTVLVIDDGIATGYTMRAALAGLRSLEPARLVVAVPVAPPSTCEDLARGADEVVCLQTPEPFLAVGAWYEDFDQVSDEEVTAILRRFRGDASPD